VPYCGCLENQSWDRKNRERRNSYSAGSARQENLYFRRDNYGKSGVTNSLTTVVWQMKWISIQVKVGCYKQSQLEDRGTPCI